MTLIHYPSMQHKKKLPHRIAAGGLIFSDKRVLLVRYPHGEDGSFLVAPGGGLEQDENIESILLEKDWGDLQDIDCRVTIAASRIATF